MTKRMMTSLTKLSGIPWCRSSRTLKVIVFGTAIGALRTKSVATESTYVTRILRFVTQINLLPGVTCDIIQEGTACGNCIQPHKTYRAKQWSHSGM